MMKLPSVSYFTNGGPRLPLEKNRATKGIAKHRSIGLHVQSASHRHAERTAKPGAADMIDLRGW